MAQTLSQFFEKKFLKVRPFGALSTTPSTLPITSTKSSGLEQQSTNVTSSIKQHMQSTISELRDSMIQMREEIQALRKEKAAAATAAKQMARQSAPGPAIPKQRGPGRPKTKNKPTPVYKSVTREDARYFYNI
jgi:outer membrane murein-binding lipoprotein Lpp